MLPILERTARRLVPSVSVLSYNPAFKFIVNSADLLPSLVWKEFRKLPPNHLRIRVGVGNCLFSNQIYYLTLGRAFWMHHMSMGLVDEHSTIVDVGCGCGRFAHHLRDLRYKGGSGFKGKYIGVDIDPEMLEWCRNNFDAERFQFVQSTHASKSYHRTEDNGKKYYSLDLLDSSANFVFSSSLFSHLLESELTNYLEESLRILKPGGHMVMSFYCLDYLPHTYGGRHTFRHTIGNAAVESLKVPEAAVAYKEDFITNLTRQVGFSSAEVVGKDPNIVQCDLVAKK